MASFPRVSRHGSPPPRRGRRPRITVATGVISKGLASTTHGLRVEDYASPDLRFLPSEAPLGRYPCVPLSEHPEPGPVGYLSTSTAFSRVPFPIIGSYSFHPAFAFSSKAALFTVFTTIPLSFKSCRFFLLALICRTVW